MNLLLDTHALIWWLADDRALGESARTNISDPQSEVYVSAASAWEISIKKALGKIEVPNDLESQIHQHDFSDLGISMRHALAAGALPRHHEDPFDRMLIAQARVEGLTIVTADARFQSYDVGTVRADH